VGDEPLIGVRLSSVSGSKVMA